MHNLFTSSGFTAKLHEDMADMKFAIKQANQKLTVLEEIRSLLEECSEDQGMVELLAVLLDRASELKAEASRLSEDLGVLEETLEDALWANQNNAGDE
ncbi:MAG: hypothetical protein J6R42_04725 [Clostridia bacterium]|nr:hypothetical protein [Clostridia bacterium]